MAMDVIELETPLTFPCRGENLSGILHGVEGDASRGVVLVVGGPQYRVGSHRQFVLLARALAAHGTPVLRFDYRGMGDSEGSLRDFADVGADIEAAIDALQGAMPSVDRVVLWGLCDAASAAAFYGWRDARVDGLVMLNPWVRTESGEAKAYIRHYYLQRLLAPAFWRKLLRLQWNPLASLGSLLSLARRARGGGRDAGDNGLAADLPGDLDLPARMFHGLSRFGGRVLLILSGRDLTADEFRDLVAADERWRALLSSARVQRHDLAEADHTFSCRAWRDQVADWTNQWLADEGRRSPDGD